MVDANINNNKNLVSIHSQMQLPELLVQRELQELAFEQLKWYKQTINQSITQYYDKIIELCKKVDPANA